MTASADSSDFAFPAITPPPALEPAAGQLDPSFWSREMPPETPPLREADHPAALVWEDPESGDILSIEPGPDEDLSALLGEATLADQPAPAPEPARLTDADVQDISAMVGAHLAVEITAEVEQLTRQHFARLMSSLYGDTLRQLTDAVCAELESKIGERIVALVQDELKDRGLLGD